MFLCLRSWVSNNFSLVFFVFKFRVPSCVQESAELKFVFESLVCKNSVFICALSSNWVFFQIFLTRISFELSKPLRSSRPYHKPLVFWLKVSQVLWKTFHLELNCLLCCADIGWLHTLQIADRVSGFAQLRYPKVPCLSDSLSAIVSFRTCISAVYLGPMNRPCQAV